MHRLFNWSRPVIYLFVTVAMLIPLVKPLGIPVPVGKDARKYYDAVNALKPDDIVWMDSHLSLSAAVECYPQMVATAIHAYKRGAKIVFLAMNPDGQPFAEKAMNEVIAQGAKYGEDVIYLGFVPGGEPALAALLADVHKAVPNDYKVTPLASLPLGARIRSGKDIAVAVPVTSDASAPDYWTRQVKPYPNIALLMASQASLWPKIQPYTATGQIKAALNGARGAAEYELLINRKGQATASMDATSVAYLTFIFLILIGNLAFYTRPKASGGKGDSK